MAHFEGSRWREWLDAAAQARRERRFYDAIVLLKDALTEFPNYGPGLNALGLVYMETGDFAGAINAFEGALIADAKALPVWLNLAEAQKCIGEDAAEIEALDSALALDPYLLPAILKKAQAQERMASPDALVTWRNLLATTPISENLPDTIRDALEHGRALLSNAKFLQGERLDIRVKEVAREYPETDLTRAIGYVDHLAGRRKIFLQQPTSEHFPYLPAIEYFNRSLFPWFTELEAATEIISEELQQIWLKEQEEFRPYVAFDKTLPANQWGELNHSPRWSAYFFLENGVANRPHCNQCPRTAHLLNTLPLLDLPNKGPTVMFSVLAPKTRIPPHTGSSNVRTTVHLPLVVPAGCGFRVGSDIREWKVGEAWAFDDTIEHEAWNDSEQPRVIMILDVWNPLLSDAERAVVRATG